MEAMITTNTRILAAARSLPIVARDERWVFTLDRDEGALFYGPRSMPRGAHLRQVTDEYALYLNKAYRPCGLMIEYYEENFIKHHERFEKLSRKVFPKQKGPVQVVDPRTAQQDEPTYFRALLESTVAASGARNVAQNVKRK